MYDLNYDENIIIQNENASWVSRENIELTNLILTNKNIYCVYKKSNGLFKRATEEVNILSLSDIKIVEGQALVQQIKHDGLWCLQIQFKQGAEYFTFYSSPKKVIPQWVAAINSTLETTISNGFTHPTQKTAKQNGPFSGLFGGIFSEVADSFRDVVDSTAESFGIPVKQQEAPSTLTKDDYTAPAQQAPHQFTQNHSFCVNCGAKLTVGAKFCPECGFKVENNDVKTPKSSEIETDLKPIEQQHIEEKVKATRFQRQQEYVGKIYKCPHCGNIVNQSDTICSSCGYHLSGKQAIASAMDFQQQLLNIEMMRQDKKVGFWDQVEALDATDKRMIALIKSYPIPNSIEDIVEFFHLAIGNIDVSKSKKSFFNTEFWDGEDRDREISNAWVGKLQQIYKKAELYFPNEPEFAHIKEAYQDIMKKLRAD